MVSTTSGRGQLVRLVSLNGVPNCSCINTFDDVMASQLSHNNNIQHPTSITVHKVLYEIVWVLKSSCNYIPVLQWHYDVIMTSSCTIRTILSESDVWWNEYEPDSGTGFAHLWRSKFTNSVTTASLHPSNSEHAHHPITNDTLHWQASCECQKLQTCYLYGGISAWGLGGVGAVGFPLH